MAAQTFFSKVRSRRKGLAERINTNPGRPQERSKSGLEMELFLVDSEGKVSNSADAAIAYKEQEKLDLDLKKECTQGFVEIGVLPRIYLRNIATRVLDDVIGVVDIAEKLDLNVFPLAVNPLKYTPVMRESGWYQVKEKIFGSPKWPLAGRCTGFHFHYSLPMGVFNDDDRFLNSNAARREKQKTVNSYNFAIAADPALTLLTQSSPIVNSKFMAKDSRMLMYRGGESLDYDGLYSAFPEFGSLPKYTVTYDELIDLNSEMYDDWLAIMRKAGAPQELMDSYRKLDFGWNPVKINKVGTIEQRGMDMNMPSLLLAVGILIKYALRDIQRQEIEVVPSSIAIKTPFLLEDGKLYVPPFWYLESNLQKFSAYEGLENDVMHNYAIEFLAFCMRSVNKKYYPALKPVQDILKKSKNTSDEILSSIRKKGYDPNTEIPDSPLIDIILSYAGKLRKDAEKTKDLMESLSEGDRTTLL
jgi:hypothetical protein